jgi:2-amino-4-hydroxy-6-hydroxymethyldihydropteridine diphosphokinase
MGGDVKYTAYISIGSNIGDKMTNCRFGVRALNPAGGVNVTGISRFYSTEPVDFTHQDWFVNAVVRIETGLEPRALLQLLDSIEKKAGRRRQHAKKFGPRILDLDILLYDDTIIDSPELTIPHPRMHQRRFVLQPICDIDPDIIHPVYRQSMIQLLGSLKTDGQDITPIDH